MGDNYVMNDGSSYSIIGHDGKERESFHTYSLSGSENRVDFVDVESIASSICKTIEDYEAGKTAAQMAKELSLQIDDFHYKYYIDTTTDVDDKVTVKLTTWYDEGVAEEKTHQEEVNDGWFTYNRTVSDGWAWSTDMPRKVIGTIKMSDGSISRKDLYSQLISRLANGRKKVEDGAFSKNVKKGGKTIECRTSLSNNDDYDYIGLEITLEGDKSYPQAESVGPDDL